MKINELKQDLAAAFRWTARLNMNEGIANHFSVCLPNSNDFFVNGSGLHFSSIKASDMVLVCLLYTSPSPRDLSTSRMPSSA